MSRSRGRDLDEGRGPRPPEAAPEPVTLELRNAGREERTFGRRHGMPPLPGLQMLRGLAALLVVLTHAASEASDHGGRLDLLPFGNFGVDIFFVISGFIIVYASVPAFAQRGAWLDFVLRRAARVVPLYWLVSTAYLLLILALREDPGLTRRYVAASYLFIPAPEPQDGADFPFYFPGWTLELEMFFYLLFAGVLPWRRPVAVAAISVAMVGVLALGTVVDAREPLSFWATTQLLEFAAGCCLAEAYLHGFRLGDGACLALAAIAAVSVLATSYLLGGWPDLRGLVWGAPALALVGAATLRTTPPSFPGSRWLERLGDASYSLYLVHYLVFVAAGHVVRVTFADGSILAPLAYAGFIIALAIAVAIPMFTGIERPLTRWLQRRIPARPAVRVRRRGSGGSGLRAPL